MTVQRVPGVLLVACLVSTFILCAAGYAEEGDFLGTWQGTMVSRANSANEYTFFLKIRADNPITGYFRVINRRTGQEAMEVLTGRLVGENRLHLVGQRFEHAPPPGWFLDELDLTIEGRELRGVYREKGRTPIRGDLRGHR